MFRDTPKLYEHDLQQVQNAIYNMKSAAEKMDELFMFSAKIVLWSKNDYPVGTLALDGEQWVFTPWNDSWIEEPGSEADMVQAPL